MGDMVTNSSKLVLGVYVSLRKTRFNHWQCLAILKCKYIYGHNLNMRKKK